MSFLPESTGLLESIDKKNLMVLNDGRTLIGYLRSIDQFGNLVLQHSVERIFVDKAYGDIYRGVFLVRGESIQMLGEIDCNLEDEATSSKQLVEMPIDTILSMQQQRQDENKRKDLERKLAIKERSLAEY